MFRLISFVAIVLVVAFVWWSTTKTIKIITKHLKNQNKNQQNDTK